MKWNPTDPKWAVKRRNNSPCDIIKMRSPRNDLETSLCIRHCLTRLFCVARIWKSIAWSEIFNRGILTDALVIIGLVDEKELSRTDIKIIAKHTCSMWISLKHFLKKTIERDGNSTNKIISFLMHTDDIDSVKRGRVDNCFYSWSCSCSISNLLTLKFSQSEGEKQPFLIWANDISAYDQTVYISRIKTKRSNELVSREPKHRKLTSRQLTVWACHRNKCKPNSCCEFIKNRICSFGKKLGHRNYACDTQYERDN